MITLLILQQLHRLDYGAIAHNLMLDYTLLIVVTQDNITIEQILDLGTIGPQVIQLGTSAF